MNLARLTKTAVASVLTAGLLLSAAPVANADTGWSRKSIGTSSYEVRDTGWSRR